jgi:transposase
LAGEAIEIITGRERRRQWSVEQKLRIVAESNEPGARVTDVAARHGMYPGLLFTWRRQVRNGALVPPSPAEFMPVRMLEPALVGTASPPAPEVSRTEPAGPSRRPATLEITLSNGCRLRIDQDVDTRALRRIVDVLRR